ncbi:BTB and MATH domain-containing protein 38-like [Mercenaria mercenaria]|uniref:BTB and MATH domain-containing protein 38-like n=1 Tax=Mercenaria mercenaria TaxID=6596 RepID=UPI00234F4440|nr:BTB and MATH domain-containing protein 38-like [Mercenaria mercenaria]
MDTSNSNVNSSGTGNKPTFDFTKQSWKDDVTFLVEGKRLYASKSVLAIFSPVFELMFGSNFKEKEDNEVPLPEKKADDFLEFLHCLYPNSSKTVSRDNVLKLLPLADEYQTLPLLEECEKTLNTHIRNQDGILSIQELLQCYNIASRHGLSEVKCLSVEEILNEDDFEVIFSEAEQIMDKDTLLNFKSNIIAQQSNRLGDVRTKLVKYVLTTSDPSRSISGFENAKGAIIEHTIANVFDPSL